MTLSRIVLDPSVREIADAIQEKTRSTSPSAVVTLMLTRYGRHLLETWEVCPARCPEPQPAAAASPVPAVSPVGEKPVAPDFVFSEAIDL